MGLPIRVGVLGLEHDHVWGNLQDLLASPLGRLVAAAEPHAELRERFQSATGCSTVYPEYASLLGRSDLDAVYVFADNAQSAELAAQAARRGLHVLVEKPMAANLAGAERMLAAAREAGVTLMVNWPIAWRPQLQKALALIAEGAIGPVHGTRFRSAHAGPRAYGCTPYFCDWLYDASRNGAGALMDYCCYGAALARTVLGQPSRVTAMAGRLATDAITVDDNAVIVMQWSHALAVTEASWTQIGEVASGTAVFYGSAGTLVVEPGADGRVLLATRDQPAGAVVEAPEPPDMQRNASAHFLSRIALGAPITGLCSPEVGRDAQEILEAGLRSTASGQAVSLPLPVYLR
jgi:predicted dehydrogenase